MHGSLPNETELGDKLQGVGDQPLVLSHQYVDPTTIADIKLVRNCGDIPGQKQVDSLVTNGFQVMTIVIVRDDSMNFGNAGVSGVKHELQTVMIKLRTKES